MGQVVAEGLQTLKRVALALRQEEVEPEEEELAQEQGVLLRPGLE